MSVDRTEVCTPCPYKTFKFVSPTLRENCDILFIATNPNSQEVVEEILERYVEELESKGLIWSLTNAMKCGTPNDKTPTAKEMLRCKSFLDSDMEYCKPKLIVVLGKPALVAVTGLNKNILQLNGKILKEEGKTPVLVCVHPSFAHNSRGRNVHEFEKGILPALRYFDADMPVDYRVEDSIEPTEEEVGFDIETNSLKPSRGIIRCFSVSDGEKAIFMEVQDER